MNPALQLLMFEIHLPTCFHTVPSNPSPRIITTKSSYNLGYSVVTEGKSLEVKLQGQNKARSRNSTMLYSLTKKIATLHRHFGASQVSLVVKKKKKKKTLPANAGDLRDARSIPRSGTAPEGGHGNPLQYSCLENPMDRGAWWATVHGVTKNRTQLK